VAFQPKTKAAKLLVTQTLSKDQLLDMVATGWTQQRIADHVSQLTGQPISQYYISKTLTGLGDEYQEAKKAQARYQAERVADIADKVEAGTLDAASARVSAENRRWVASRLDPATYGDRQAIDVQLTDVTALHMVALRDAMKTVSTVKSRESRESKSSSD
jgi:hypothetical protein